MATTTTRTRVISQNKAVFVAPTDWLTLNTGSDIRVLRNVITGHQLHRIDTASFDIDLAASRQDVREFGQLARVSTVRLSEIDPTLTLGYYLGNGENELALGFNTGASDQMCGNIIAELTDFKERNIFITTVKEGEDAFNTGNLNVYDNWIGWADSGYVDTIGFGNAFVNSYSVNLAVGEIPRVDVEFQASNVVFWTGDTQGLFNPSLDLDGTRTHSGLVNLPPPSTGAIGHYVLRPHDVTVSFTDDQISDITEGDEEKIGGVNLSNLALQSCSIELPLAREVIDSLGSERAYAKPVEFPIDVTVSMSSLVKEFSTGALEYALTGSAGNNTTNISIQVKNDGNIRSEYALSGAVLDSYSFSQGLDDNETIDLTFSAQIGGAGSTDQGLFFYGAESVEDAAQVTAPSFTGSTGEYIGSGVAAANQPISVVGWDDATGDLDEDGVDEGPDGLPDGFPDPVA